MNYSTYKQSLTAYKRDRKYTTILGVQVNSTEQARVLTRVEGWIAKKGRFFVVTPNPEIVMMAQDDTVLTRILNRADISLPDGVGLVWASKILSVNQLSEIGSRIVGLSDNRKTGKLKTENRKMKTEKPILHRVSGVDVMEALIGLASKRGWRVFLLGGKPGVAEEAADKLKIKNLKLKIEADPGPLLDSNGQPINNAERMKEREVIKKISLFSPHLLFVGFGAPKQEKWVASNYNKLQTLGTMVVGGAFDYISGRIPRAPKWMREVGFEWLFRLIVEPWRLRRQFALLRFAWAVLNSH
ncbi:WecB/TagA/CpsF family glycosyltransferase [Candidatus Microgenomates bacterium]|nr:WecB/TagA/CpsF family glycosyltransferase [Candidatus Microgenomates bacterium]